MSTSIFISIFVFISRSICLYINDSFQNIFYYVIKEEFLRIACSILCFDDFITETENLLKLMQIQGSVGNKTENSLKKTTLAHPQNFQQFFISYKNVPNILATNSK